jgi:glycosyltransferase involved in cell wall biosynthesis
MKILILQEADWLARNPAQQHHLAERMSLKGHELRVIDHELSWRKGYRKGLYSKRKEFGVVSKVYEGASIKLVRPGFIQLPVLDYFSVLFTHNREIKYQLREFRPDIIVGFGILNSYLASLSAKKNRLPFVYYWIDVLHLLIPTRIFRSAGKLIETATLKRADLVLTINEQLNDLVVRMGAPVQRARVLSTGVNLQLFSPERDVAVSRGRYGFEKQDTILFFMGFLYKFSGLKEVALKLVQSANKRIKLMVVGHGDAYEELRQLQEKDTSKQIVLLGQRPYHEMPELIAAADICILPAHSSEKIMQDIVPVKVYEYMAMQKPVISTRLPGVMREFGQENGVVYVDRPQDVVDKAMELNSEDRTVLGIKARRFAEKKSWERITIDFENLLEHTILMKKAIIADKSRD